MRHALLGAAHHCFYPEAFSASRAGNSSPEHSLTDGRRRAIRIHVHLTEALSPLLHGHFQACILCRSTFPLPPFSACDLAFKPLRNSEIRDTLNFLTAKLQTYLLNPLFLLFPLQRLHLRKLNPSSSRLHSVFPQKLIPFQLAAFPEASKPAHHSNYEIKPSKLHVTFLHSLPSPPHPDSPNQHSVASMSPSWFPTSDHSFPIFSQGYLE